MFIINAPKTFSMIWSVVKLWLDKRTLAKIKVYGSDYHEKLFGFVDPHDLPEHIGGHLDSEEAMFSTSNIWDAEEMKQMLEGVANIKFGDNGEDSPNLSPESNHSREMGARIIMTLKPTLLVARNERRERPEFMGRRDTLVGLRPREVKRKD